MRFGNSRNTLKASCFPFASDVLRLWDGGTRMALLNPAKGSYVWDALDNQVAAANGFDLIYVFGSTPPWAAEPVANAPTPAGGWAAGTNCPMDLGALGAFVDALMARYGTKIKYFEPWNEWNAPGFYCGSIEQLAAMTEVIQSRVKRANPAAIVTTPTPVYQYNVANGHNWSAWPTIDKAFAAWLVTCVPFDVVTFHGYLPLLTAPDGTVPNHDAMQIAASIQALKAVMKTNGITCPLWDTEFGPQGDLSIVPNPRQWVLDALLARMQNGVDLACWYQCDNLTHGPHFTDLTNSVLNAYGQAWVDFFKAVH